MRLLIFFLLILNFGCMEELENQQQAEIAPPQIGAIIDESKTLSSSELQLAQGFCQSLSEKERTFSRDYLGATISFQVKRRECAEDKAELKVATIKARLGNDSRSGTLRFFPMDYYLPMMTEIETANHGIFAEFCPDILLNIQKTNSREFDGEFLRFRFIPVGENQIMSQVLKSDEADGEINQIDEVVVQSSGENNRPRGLTIRKILIQRCGNIEGNGNSFFWSQEL